MLNKISLIKILIFVVVAYFVWFFFYFSSLPSELNNDICEFSKQEVKGVIVGQDGHGDYNWIELDNHKKSFWVSIEKTLYKKGFPEYYSYEIGDSLIKKGNSKEFTIKRGDSIVVHLLYCDD